MNKHLQQFWSRCRQGQPRLGINKPIEWNQFQEIIKATLYPTFLTKLTKNSSTNESLVQSFEKHTAVIAKYCSEYFKMNSHLSTRFITDLHRMFYPPGFTIRAVQYDGVHVDQKPGEWRKTNFLSNPVCIDASSTSDIESDLQKLLEKFNGLSKIAREDILEFYCIFIRIHPFGDSNGTIAALICDIECFRQQLGALNMLHLRFKDKSFLFCMVDMYDKSRTRNTLEQMLIEIDGFHDKDEALTSRNGTLELPKPNSQAI